MFKPEYTVSRSPNGICITMPVRRSWARIVMTLLVLAGVWFVLLHGVLTGEIRHAFGFAIMIFTIMNIVALYVLAWQLFGQEQITIRADLKRLEHRFALFSKGQARFFALALISHWRVVEYAPKSFSITDSRRNPAYNFPPVLLMPPNNSEGAWSFIYGGREIFVGRLFDTEQALLANALLAVWMPHLAKSD